MPSFKRISVAEARKLLVGKHISYTFQRDGEMATILVKEVVYFKGLFHVRGFDKMEYLHELLFGGNAIVFLNDNKQYETYNDSEVRPFYAKYVLTD